LEAKYAPAARDRTYIRLGGEQVLGGCSVEGNTSARS
jgi:hypothetical protein